MNETKKRYRHAYSVSARNAEQIRRLREQGMTRAEVAKATGFSIRTVSKYAPMETNAWNESEHFNALENFKAITGMAEDALADVRKKRYRAAAGKQIRWQEIYGRDGGVCQICGESVDPDDFYIQRGVFVAGPDFPSTDHIVPVSRGGKTSLDNVQLAHVKCNTKKSNKLIGEEDGCPIPG